MNKILLLPLLLILQVGCSSVATTSSVASKTAHKTIHKESAVRTLLDGTFIVRKTANTPIKTNQMASKYYQYYSGLHADSIGCKSYSQIKLKVSDNEKAYKCVVNGEYLTKNSIALGTPWQ